MIRIKDYIFNENEIVKIQFDDGPKEMEIDHKNGNRTFIDGTFDDIEWNYGTQEKMQIDNLEKELNELKSDYSMVVTENKKLKEENEKLKFAMQDTYDSSNDTCGELQQRIDKAIEYIGSITDVKVRYFNYREFEKQGLHISNEELRKRVKEQKLEGQYIEIDRDDILKILKGE